MPRHVSTLQDVEAVLKPYQSRIPVWFDSNQCHRPQTDKWKTVGSLAGTRTVPLPGKAQEKACIPPFESEVSQNKEFGAFFFLEVL